MTKQQRRALDNPALIAEECVLPRFHERTALGTVTLTVNTGYE